MKRGTLCIYHAGCDDGFGGAWVVQRAVRQGVLPAPLALHPGRYGEPAPPVHGYERVVIVDFSYSRPVLAGLRDVLGPGALTVIDHHASSRDTLAAFAGAAWSDRRSGATLAWTVLLGHDAPIPWPLQHIEDRDLWRFELPMTREFTAWFRSMHGGEVSGALWLLDGLQRDDEHESRAGVMVEGGAILRREAAMVDRIVEHAALMPFPVGSATAAKAVVVCSPVLQSEVGHRLLASHPEAALAVVWHVRADGRIQASFRSDPDRIRADHVAESYGGGGHPAAAGAVIDPTETRITLWRRT